MHMDEVVAKEYAKFVRSVSFDNDKDYLWGEGTAFFVRYKRSMYLITAKHNVIKDGHIMAKDLFVTLDGGSGPVYFDRFSFFEIDGGCEDSEDFALFHVNAEHAESKGMHISSPLDIDEFALGMPDVLAGSPLRVIGYPTVSERYDWDRKVIHNHMLIKDGHYSPSALGSNFGQMKGTSSDIQFSGISGAPVLGVLDGRFFLAGVAIRATSSSGIINYVKVDCIAKAVFAEYEIFKGESTRSIFSQL